MSTVERAQEGTLLTKLGPEEEGKKNIRNGIHNLPVDTV
jgi:hypothetical protein